MDELVSNKKCDPVEVLFVLPPFFKFMEENFTAFPTGLGSMVASLRLAGINSEIYNADIHHSSALRKILKKITSLFEYRFYNLALKWSKLYSSINDPQNISWIEAKFVLETKRPKIVGITCSVVTIPSTIIFASLVKEVLPDSKVIVGGPAATTCPENLISESSIDFLVIGEGEETIVELCNYLLNSQDAQSDLNKIKGIMYKTDCGPTTTEFRPLITDINLIPFPDRKSMFVCDNSSIQKYFVNTDIISSRGCPYPCKFCACYKVWGTRKPRVRSVDNIIAELNQQILVYGQKDFVFWDDLFTVDRERVVDFCTRVIENKLDIRWVCLVRLNSIDPELLALMQRAGCVEIQIGIESGNDRVLKHIGKSITLEMIKKQTSIIERSSITWSIFLIIGFPSETRHEIMDTLNLVTKIKPSNVYLSIFSPYPGTSFYNELSEQGLLGNNFIKSDVWYTGNNYTGTMDDDEFSELALYSLKFCDKYNQNFARRFKRLIKLHSRLSNISKL